MNSNNRIAATVYSLGTLFVSGIYVQPPCIKKIMTIIIIITGKTCTVNIKVKFLGFYYPVCYKSLYFLNS
jgi:hypothetical protein